MKRTVSAPDILVLVWIVIAGAGMALAAAAAMEPPSYDPFSYVVKAFGFWDAVTHGRLFNPFGLGPNVRPPGTILVSYPFGFSPDFRWFYFRTCFIPLLMLTTAVYVAGFARAQTPFARWILAALAVTLGGMPTLYQFQHNDLLQAASFWGLVDNFLGGAAALAMAAVIRSVQVKSWRWALAGALAAALSLMIKPSGLLVMAVVGLAWIILVAADCGWNFARLKSDGAKSQFAVKGFKAAAIVYVLTMAAAFLTPYFSRGNIAFGSQVLSVMGSTILSSLRADAVLLMTRTSFGVAITAVIVAGFGAAAILRTARGEVLAAALCLIIGLWFWLIETDVALVRYALPFAAMTFVAVVPVLLALAERAHRVNAGLMALGAVAAVAPTVVVTVLMLQPNPPLRWQAALGVNLVANYYQAENDQAAALVAKMKAEADLKAPVYVFHTTPALRNFAAGLMYAAFLDPAGPQANLRLPMDWQRSTTFRVSEILTSRYIAFEPVLDDAMRAALLEKGAKDFNEEYQLMSAVFTTLTEADGLCPVSETRVRVVEVCAPEPLAAAMARLQQAYAWTPAFRDANAM